MRSLFFHSADFDTSDGKLNWMAFESKSSFDEVGPIRAIEIESGLGRYHQIDAAIAVDSSVVSEGVIGLSLLINVSEIRK